ncbi:FAD-binding and (Fe-S)-binding domain-containing protein [Nannocystis sp. SCPEA4]|uniref:FAD-binding and (Fe-S)-binding domain-containing protein n=1 Tax=Nannocystis sp. SCPEA4 TaxID=2996787 RepID=UPI0022717351|nr:FAD-binding and (Fe-S)-binding domain-containing protein [Nannocystis sp. SCPEA4]MCY1059047.1 FAD-binding and (Fe-S)-binding domain-containing protein [Nannocystis sp. SCPEA4]
MPYRAPSEPLGAPTLHLPVVDQDAAAVDVRGLAQALSRHVHGEVRFDAGSRALYSTDASNYRQVPIGVVLPSCEEDVVATFDACRRFGAPVLARGGGTSLAGQCCNVAVVLDFSKYMNRLLELDPGRRLARVQPGLVLDDLRDAGEKYHLTFGPDPSTHNRCTLGGMLGNNSCGVHAQMAGKTSRNTEELDVLTYDGTRLRVGRTDDDELAAIIRAGGRRGQIYAGLSALRDRYAGLIRQRFPNIPRRVSGYGLDELLPENHFQVARALVGTEATCVTILEATVELIHSPPYRVLALLGFADVFVAAEHVPAVLEGEPIALEGLDDRLMDHMRRKGLHPETIALLPEGAGWLMVEFGGETRDEADARAHALVERLRKGGGVVGAKVFDRKEVEGSLWKIREAGLGATARVPGERDTCPGWEDSAVAPDDLAAYLRDLRKLFDDYGYQAALYGHFGQGCVHCRVSFDLLTTPGIRRFREFLGEAARLVTSYGGSLSGEHGDGQARGELLSIMFGDELVEAFREFKAIWDPDGKMNPGKVVDPRPLDADLRLGPSWSPKLPALHMRLDEDESMPRAATRCVGVGLCRKERSGTMCPSYMVTREEMHSTRGRAHLLFEAVTGDTIRDGMHSEHVKEALDLCLACKACKAECPVNVDMATYKAEFLAHYFEAHRRPLAAYAFGFIDVWSRLASRAPRLANFMLHARGLGRLAKAIVGIAPARSMPRYASETFRAWFRRREPPAGDGPRVLLWPDTFHDHFHPEVAIAAVRALEAIGYRVDIPPPGLCCGRPLYDFGFLDVARRRLLRIIDAMRPDIQAGVPLVGIEPSCTAVFRDEMPNMLSDDQDARRLRAQTKTLAEFVSGGPLDVELPRLGRDAVVHGHCHHKAVLGFEADRRLLDRLGLEFEVLDSGCCGMAGAFGFESDHYEVSLKAGERVLLPAVRRAAEETLVVADGFSCRTQIEQTTGRRPLHLAQLLEMSLCSRGPSE